MRIFFGKQGGSICVFLTLILVPVLIFSGIIVDASRLFASKTVVSGAGDLAMNAALAQYDKMLKDSYGLTAMAKDPGSPEEQEALKQMFCESISARYLKHADTEELSSVIQVSLAENGFEAKGVSSSSLADVNVLRQQIVEYMKFRGPVYIADDIIEKLKKLPWFRKAVKIAISIGKDADDEVLIEFTGNSELVLQANNATALARMIKWASTTASMVSAPSSKPVNSTPASAPIAPAASVAPASAAASQPVNANTPAAPVNNGAPLVLDMSNIPDPDDFDDGAVW